MSKISIVCVVIVILILMPHVSMTSSPGETHIYGVTIYLTTNEKLNGYIETNWNLNACNENKRDNITWECFLERQREFQSKGTNDNTVRFINKLINLKYNNKFRPFAVTSSVKEIKINDIKSIEGVCKNWDGYVTMSGIQTITDYMAKYIANHKLIAFYVYDEDALVEAGKLSGEECGLCACITTYLSYNQEYTRERLTKLRKKIDKMSNDILDKERLIRFIECWD